MSNQQSLDAQDRSLMNTLKQVMAELKKKGSEKTRKTLSRHGVPDDMFGVKIGDLKVIARKIKGNQQLACELYETGNYDAMYLAGIVADGSQMTKRQIEAWAKGSTCGTLSEYPVAWVAVESPHARALALKWIKSKQKLIASSGWCTYAGMVAVKPDQELDLAEVGELLDHVASKIDTVADNVRYTMNGFVISVGCYVKPLLSHAKRTARKIGTVTVDMGETACQVPHALTYIEKVVSAGRVGKKRKTVKC